MAGSVLQVVSGGVDGAVCQWILLELLVASSYVVADGGVGVTDRAMLCREQRRMMGDRTGHSARARKARRSCNLARTQLGNSWIPSSGTLT